MKLRPYQAEAVDRVFAEWERGTRSTLTVMPTGTGKTVLFSAIIDRARANRTLWPGQWMVVVHREELAHQASEKLENIGLVVQIEMADMRAETNVLRRPDVVVASIQTLIRRGLRFKPHEFAGLVIDEAHHYTSPSWRAYIEHLKQNEDLKILGVTATPKRADEHALRAVFESVAFNYKMKAAIDDGYLVDLDIYRVFVEGLDFTNVHTTAGDLNARELANLMSSEKVLHKITSSVIEHTVGKRTIIFTPPGFKTDADGQSFRVSERLCEILNRHMHGCAALVSDRTDKDLRRELIKSFKAGKFQYMVNVGIFTEGYDDPSLECVVMARPTESRSLYEQMLGRGTRPLPGVVDGKDTAEERKAAIAASAKPSLRVLDFCGVSGKHKLVSPVDILGGEQPPEIVDLAHRKMQTAGRSMTVDEAIEEAKEQIAQQRRREEDEKKRREAVKATAQARLVKVDPFNVLDVHGPQQDADSRRSEPATENQRKFLARMGVVDNQGLSKKEASKLIAGLSERRRRGLCTFKQAAFLKRNGIDPRGVTFQDAMMAIDMCMKGQKSQAVRAFRNREWMVPEEVN